MRGSRPVVLVALLLVGQLAAGTAVVAGDHTKQVTISGTVTGVTGAPAEDATVLVGDDSTLTKHPPTELRKLAAAHPRNLSVVAVGPDGRFETTLDSSRAEAAVAVSDAGISDLVYVRGENATLSMRLHERRPQTVHAHLGAVAADERRADLYVSLVNTGDVPIDSLSVHVGPLPEGWTVANVTTAGRYHRNNRTITWASVAPGAEVDTTVVLAVPTGTAVGEYTVGLRAASGTHPVGVAPATVEVLPEETATPTRMPSPVGDGGDAPTTDALATTGRPTGRATGPGFGATLAVAALALTVASLVRRG